MVRHASYSSSRPKPGAHYGLQAALQLVDFPDASGPKELHYDAEWLAVLRMTHQLMSLQRRPVTLPGARHQRLAADPHIDREWLPCQWRTQLCRLKQWWYE